jgi:hypothetical protein
MSDQAQNRQGSVSPQHEIELLARETEMPLDIVQEIYFCEHAKLDQAARIKTYVPVLVRRQVKELLQAQRAAP